MCAQCLIKPEVPVSWWFGLLFFEGLHHNKARIHESIRCSTNPDIDECLSSPSPCSDDSDCANLEGSFLCTCPPGYVYRDFWDICNKRFKEKLVFKPIISSCFSFFFQPIFLWTQLMRGVMLYGVRWIGTQVTCPYLGVLRKQKFLKSFLLAVRLESYLKVVFKLFP